jgi:hypothetical protein
MFTLAGLPSKKCIPLPLNRFNNQINDKKLKILLKTLSTELG